MWHLASLDAPTVAIVWAYAFAQAAGVRLQGWVAVLLFAGTWSVYVGDRLLDAHGAMRSGELGSLRERHFFHWRYRRILIPLAACSAMLAVALVFRLMPRVMRERNSVLAAAAVVYFSGVHSPSRLPGWLRKSASKELLVGVLFTAGCATPTLSHLPAAQIWGAWPLLACLAYFAMLAWCNCTAIDRWESTHARSGVQLQAGLLAVAGVAIAIALAADDGRLCALTVTATASSALLLLLDRIRLRISPPLLRVLADAVLLTPAVLLLFGVVRG